MLLSLPRTAHEFMAWEWSDIEPYFQELESRPLTAANIEEWLMDWSRLSELVEETRERLWVATTLDTTDKDADQRFLHFLQDIFEQVEAADSRLKSKLLDSRLQPEGFEIPLRNIRAKVELFRDENLPLLTEQERLCTEYRRIVSSQTVRWEGEERTIPQLYPVFQNPDRAVREHAWRLGATRQLADRESLNALWRKFMELRREIAHNAGLDDFRAYRWKQMLRFDYTPQDCAIFHDAIEKVVVPAAERIYDKHRRQLGLDTLRPWDTEVDPLGRLPLRPFEDVGQLVTTTGRIFNRVDPQLGDYYERMVREELLDLDNHQGKAPGAYCTHFVADKQAFIFMNAVGIHDDAQTLLHEAGHAFHNYERFKLPYYHQLEITMEIAEVASMAMELLAAPYLRASEGGFYSDAEAARARIEHMEGIIRFWPYMAVVDAFQHWVYENYDAALDPTNCDAKWAGLWGRFMRGIDWTGFDDVMMTGWHRKLHIFEVPFYYVDYGLAQMGAVQVWRNALNNQAEAVANYRKALALGGTKPLPELFAAAGAKFAFDADTLGELVALLESTIDKLENETQA
jgi:oligoendopeptidase F